MKKEILAMERDSITFRKMAGRELNENGLCNWTLN